MAFKSLLPTHLTTELEPYQEAFDFALDPKNKNITNIAVTGNYGAGKSSVISSYFHQKNQNKTTEHVDDCFLRKPISNKEITISLATFKLRSTDSTGSSDKPNSGSETSQQLDKNNTTAIQNIEFNILQQLIHKTHPNQLPKSRFERIIHKHNDNEYVFSTITIVLLLLTFVSIGLISEWKFLEKFSDLIGFEPNPLFSFIPAFSILALIILATRYCVHSNLFHKKDMQSIDILKGQVAFKNKDNQSVLNLFLDEILYFFEQTHYDVVIFEDLDRLEHKEIFIRLREINLIINNSEQVQRPIKFIYAIKDDLFEDQETRVKFFDFIIPIIPVMDFDNSYNHLQEEIKRIDIKVLKALNKDKLLRDISDHINDMRLLVNIVNEYKIYLKKEINQHKIELCTIDENRLRKIFALIVYKNLMPEDFSLIQSKKSILCQIVKDYRSKALLREIISILQTEFDKISKEIQPLNLIKNKRLDDLKITIINKLLFSEITQSQNIFIGQNSWSQKIFNDEEKINFFDEHIKKDKNLPQQQFYFNQNSSFSSPNIDSDIINIYLDEYDQNQQLLTDNFDERLGDLNEQLLILKRKIAKHYSFTETIHALRENNLLNQYEEKYYQLKQINSIKTNENEFQDTRPIYTEKPIIFMLIRKGYIDQTYINYLSLSHESASELREFRKAIADDENSERNFYLSLTNDAIHKFLKEEEDILSEHASSRAILNFSLISYLLKQKNTTGPSIQGNVLLLSDILNFHYLGNSFNLNFLTKYINEYLPNTEYKYCTLQIIQEIFTNPKSFQHLFKEIQSQNFNDLPDDIKTILLLILVQIDINSPNRYTEKFSSILGSIPNFITCFDYLELHNQPVENVITWLQEAKIKIDLMTPSTDTNSFSYKLFRAVIDNSLYKITDKNIIHIFEYDGYSTEELKTMHYSTLCTKYDSDTHMRRYIEENISTYVNNILIAKKLSTQETPENIIALINNKFLDNNQRIEIIKQNTSFIIEKNLSDIEFEEIIQCIENDISFGQQLLELDLEYRKQNKFLIKPTWLNAYWLLTQNELISQDNQASWLNVIYNNISMIEGITEDQKPEFKDIIIFNDQLSNDAYKHLVNLLQLEVTNGDLEELIKLQWEKIQILMELQLVKLSQESVDMIYETFINPTQEEEEND